MNLLQDKYQDLCDIGKEWKLPVVGKTVSEWVKIAERLAKEYNGVLPRRKWLGENGYWGLVGAIQRCPERFAHIEQEKFYRKTDRAAYKTIDEWAEITEKLVREHGGVLPRQTWLKENGYGGLVRAIYNHPELFGHVRQQKIIFKTIEERIVEAEKLIKEHGGILPSGKWFDENGDTGLKATIKRYPERFAHIKQERLRKTKKTVEEHIAEAENLVREHGGVLPKLSWLRGNGYDGLVNVIYKYPEQFAHIRRMIWNKAV